ncbi:class A sortase [Enterococcus pseudoavium]|nr:class A sortase [Enterococcus pseudoavium]
MKRFAFNIIIFIVLIVGFLLVFNKQVSSFLMLNQTDRYRVTKFTKKELQTNSNEKGNYDFDSVKPVSTEQVVKAQFDKSKLPIIGAISIPSIEVSLPIFKGLDNSALLAGAGTMKLDQKLGSGNYSLASHSTVDKSLLFSPLEFLSLGEKIYLTDLENIYTFTVVLKEIVKPTKVDVIEDVPNRRLVTLVTCGDLSALTRLVVQGELQEVKNFKESDLEVRSYFN